MKNETSLYMQRCLDLARLGMSFTSPNPMVGAVLVVDDKVIGEGYHVKYGQPHAEPNAIHSVEDKELLKRATLYVNLEPCSHFGKTPPCANLIVSSGIPKVVIGTLDPNPKVAGKGVKILQEAGIEVEVGVLENECRELNKRFFVFQEQNRPFVFLKWAQTADGFIDRLRTADSLEKALLISNPLTQQLTHKMRAENQAILVSTNTVLLDNPSLTVRNWRGKNPVRIALDRRGIIPNHYHLKDGAVPTLIFTSEENKNQPNLEYVSIDFEHDCLKQVLDCLYQKGINSVLVEGGAKLLTSFIQAGMWDEANVEISPMTIGSGVAAPSFPYFPTKRSVFENHEWLFFKNPKPQF